MKEDQFHTLLRFSKALMDESRLKILGILANHQCSVEELAALLQLKEPTVSHHLAKLKELNLVRICPEGNTHLYQLDCKVLQSMSKEIFAVDKMMSLAEDVESEDWESKILKNYVQGDSSFADTKSVRLKEIPASHKKRLVILKWLAKQFEVGVNYPEYTVNEILKRYHPDCATLRRELIDNHLMQREKGFYWRSVEV